MPLLSLLAATAAAAASHTVTLTLSDGKDTWTHTESLQAGSHVDVNTPLKGRRLLFNALPTATRTGMTLQYQVDLSPAKTGRTAATFQVQGELALRPERTIRAASCGPWTLDLGLDAEDGEAGADFGAGDGNLRVSSEFVRGKYKTACSAVLQDGAQGNVVEGTSRASSRTGTILNILAVRRGGGADVQAQYERSDPDGSTVQVQKEAKLTFGKSQVLVDKPHRFALKIEGAAAK